MQRSSQGFFSPPSQDRVKAWQYIHARREQVLTPESFKKMVMCLWFFHINLQKSHLFECVKHARAALAMPFFQLSGVVFQKSVTAPLYRETHLVAVSKNSSCTHRSWYIHWRNKLKLYLILNHSNICSVPQASAEKRGGKKLHHAIHFWNQKVSMNHKQHNQLKQLRPNIINSFFAV